MHNHAPENYLCPFCTIGDKTNKNTSYVFYRDKDITAFISSNEWPPNSGIALIIPNKHFENLYDIPAGLLGKINTLSKQVAVAMKATYQCEGVSTRQHNEPAGDQTVWHFHLQVVPRYNKDRLNLDHHLPRNISDKDRSKYALMLKKYLNGK